MPPYRDSILFDRPQRFSAFLTASPELEGPLSDGCLGDASHDFSPLCVAPVKFIFRSLVGKLGGGSLRVGMADQAIELQDLRHLGVELPSTKKMSIAGPISIVFPFQTMIQQWQGHGSIIVETTLIVER